MWSRFVLENADDVHAGDHIPNEGSEYKYSTVTEIRVIYDASQRMYNLTVDKAHTFFVGDQ